MRYCFYSEYRDIKGGYTSLLLTFIRELVCLQQEVVLINFKTGLLVHELEKEHIQVLVIDLDSTPWQCVGNLISSDDILLVSRFGECLKHLFKNNPRIVYYDINDFICQISDYKYGWKFPSLGRQLINTLLANNAVVFMDNSGIFNLQSYFSLPVIDPKFLPIPVTIPNVNLFLQRVAKKDNILRLTYIGRSVDWKMMPLKKILQDCTKVNLKYEIYFTVVVDDLTKLHQFINFENYSNPNFRINLIENISPSSISSFLLENSDLHFAMGTAALEAAKIGVPTILVDYSTENFPENYKYMWLFESVNFNLGRNLTKLSGIGEHSMTELLDEVHDFQHRISLSKLSYEYVLKNHLAETIALQFIALCNKSTFRIKGARKFIPYFFRTHALVKRIFLFFKKL